MSEVKKENDGMEKKRILCIDGGGVLGTFPAAFLAELEKHLDHPIGKYFDLIAGTSTRASSAPVILSSAKRCGVPSPVTLP